MPEPVSNDTGTNLDDQNTKLPSANSVQIDPVAWAEFLSITQVIPPNHEGLIICAPVSFPNAPNVAYLEQYFIDVSKVDFNEIDDDRLPVIEPGMFRMSLESCNQKIVSEEVGYFTVEVTRNGNILRAINGVTKAEIDAKDTVPEVTEFLKECVDAVQNGNRSSKPHWVDLKGGIPHPL